MELDLHNGPEFSRPVIVGWRQDYLDFFGVVEILGTFLNPSLGEAKTLTK